MNQPDEGLPKRVRLRRSADYRRVQGHGRRWRGRCLVALYERNGLSHPRLGLVVSRKVGNAVVRNRVKRRLREASRRQLSTLTGVDLVLIARSDAAAASYAALAGEVGRVFELIRREHS